ncbi:MAG: UDP-3-O-(3-hydroxymyristoyl)glucosamine N-acyltransferase [Saccharofermentanales bacterium]
MYLSEILKEMGIDRFSTIDEREFDYLSLLLPTDKERMLSFMDNLVYKEDIPGNLSMLLVKEDMVSELGNRDYGLCLVADPRDLFFRLHNYLCDREGYMRPVFASRIHPSASISDQSFISDTNVVIGRDVVIEPFVMVYPNTVIEDHTIIRAGTTIGGMGFEFKRSKNIIMSVAHAGGVVIGDYVEIQNNSCIDRAVYPWDDTVIGSYSKVNNFVHIAHGCKIGKRAMIVAHVSLGGRVVVGDDVWLGTGVSIRNGITIGDGARVNMGSVVTRSVGAGESVTGNFAIPHDQFLARLKKDLQSLSDKES